MSEENVGTDEALVESVLEPNWEDLYQLLGSMELTIDNRERANKIAKWTADDIARSATLLHAVLAPESDPVPSRVTRTVSPPGGSNVTELVSPEDRYALLKVAADEIASLGIDGQSQPEEFLERAAYITAAALVMAHPFEDGNGRTSRVLAHTIKEGFDVSAYETMEELKLIGKNRPANGYRLNSYVPATESSELAIRQPEVYLQQVASPDIKLSNQEAYHEMLSHTLRTPYT